MDVRVVTLPSGNVEYSVAGSGSAVLVAHGTLGGYDQGAAISQLFDHAKFQFIAVSRAGYLNSAESTGRTAAEQAHTYAALLDAEGIEKAAILGVSGGGPSTLKFAELYPDRCTGAVLLASVTQTPTLPPLFDLFIKMQVAMMRLDLVWNLFHRFGLPMIVRSNGASAEQVNRALNNQQLRPIIDGIYAPIKTVSKRRHGLQIDHEQIQSLPGLDAYKINVPLFICHAVDDPLAPFAQAEALKQHFPHAEFHSEPDGGHIFFAIHRKRIAPIIERFLMEAVS